MRERTCVFAQSETAARGRGNSRADLNRGAFAAKGHTAGQGDGGADELSNHRPKPDDAILQDQSDARLWDPAPAGVGKVFEQQPACHQRAQQRTQDALYASRSQQHPAHALRDSHEGNHDQTDRGTNDQRQQEQNLLLVLS